MSDNTWGWLIGFAALAFGGEWLHDNFEVRRKVKEPSKVAPITPILRPTGMVYVAEDKSGSVWRLNADSVRGDRRHRQGWVVVDASKDKTITNWRTRHELYYVDCDTTAIRSLSTLYYDAKGNSKWPSEALEPKAAKVEYYPETTMGFAPVRELCSRSYDGPTK